MAQNITELHFVYTAATLFCGKRRSLSSSQQTTL
jgi:hypothetical protein